MTDQRQQAVSSPTSDRARDQLFQVDFGLDEMHVFKIPVRVASYLSFNGSMCMLLLYVVTGCIAT